MSAPAEGTAGAGAAAAGFVTFDKRLASSATARAAGAAAVPASAPAPSLTRVVTSSGTEIPIEIRFADVNPLNPMLRTLAQPHNLLTFLFSGLTFASQYSLAYVATSTFGLPPYSYDPLAIGLILFALGAGGMIGSVAGGRISDRALVRIRQRNQRSGRAQHLAAAAAEERLHTVIVPCLVTPFTFVTYAWLVQYKVHIAGPCVVLFFLGLVQFWAYSAVLSYLVDSNPGRTSAAVSMNSLFRGAVACVASQIAGPLQHSMATAGS